MSSGDGNETSQFMSAEDLQKFLADQDKSSAGKKVDPWEQKIAVQDPAGRQQVMQGVQQEALSQARLDQARLQKLRSELPSNLQNPGNTHTVDRRSRF